MKITASTPYVISVPTGQEIRDPGTGELICSAKKSWIFLKLETDAGIVGWGDGGGEWLSMQVVAALDQLKPLLYKPGKPNRQFDMGDTRLQQ